MPTWKDIFDGVPWDQKKGQQRRCNFCRLPKQNLQPLDIVRKGYIRRQTKYFYLCCHECWRDKSFVVYEP